MLTFTVPGHVRPGAKIPVVNKDAFLHSVTVDDGTSFGKDVPGGTKVTITAPLTPGGYPFHCRIHSSMHATLVVKAPR
jgi:plastocyanin